MDTCMHEMHEIKASEHPLGSPRLMREDASPLRRALRAHFSRYEGLTVPRSGPQEDKL